MVEELYRKLGIGRALVDEAEQWSASVGGIYISLATRRAGAFYVALGYDESATFFKKATPRGR
jgi:GNAT superfamily N-acetyltransferase